MGALDSLDTGGDPSPGDARSEGAFSIVVGSSEGRIRKLPGLYFGKAQMFSDRKLEAVQDQLVRMVEMVKASVARPTYLLHPCRLEGRDGLYARDLFNRSPYRRKLGRLGMAFAERPFTWLDAKGRWMSDDWSDFEPSFLVFAGGTEDPSEVIGSTSGLLLFRVASYRLGALQGEELSRLTSACASLEAVAAGEAEALVAQLVES